MALEANYYHLNRYNSASLTAFFVSVNVSVSVCLRICICSAMFIRMISATIEHRSWQRSSVNIEFIVSEPLCPHGPYWDDFHQRRHFGFRVRVTAAVIVTVLKVSLHFRRNFRQRVYRTEKYLCIHRSKSFLFSVNYCLPH